MATPQITRTGVYVTPTREELLANGLVEEVQEYVSPVTFIKYRFRRFVDANRTMSFVPLIIQDENRQEKRLYISGVRRPVQQADGTLINVSDADLIVRTMPELRLVKYPDDRAQTYSYIPGLHNLHDAGYFFVGPLWCTTALFMLEANPGSQNVQQFTTVMSDRIPFQGGAIVMERGQTAIPNLTNLQDPAVAPLLTLKANVKKVDAATGQETTDVQTLPGDQLLQNKDFIARYVKEVTLQATDKITNVLIGSPFCVDLVSEFVVPNLTVPAVPQPVVQPVATIEPPQVPLPEPAAQIPTPGGLLPSSVQPGTFQPAPVFAATTTTSQRRIPVVQLTPAMVARLDFFLTKSKCADSGALVRIDNLIKVLIESQAKDGGSKGTNKYLSLSSCRFAVKGTGSTVKRIMRNIPGTQQTLNLSITPEDLSTIINGSTVQSLPQNDWESYVEAVFREIEAIIFEHLGKSLQNPEVEGLSVPLSILDTIPAGPSPAGRPLIIARSPFVEKVALSGVTEVTVPITDGKKCLPGLMAKKRD